MAASLLVALVLCVFSERAHAQDTNNGLQISVPNGYVNINVEDLRIQSTAGAIRWGRVWDGQEWKFNPHWESLSQSWRNLTGSRVADTTGPAPANGALGSGGGDSGCWVWVDEDWSPSVGTTVINGIPEAGPMVPVRTTPFNRLMGENASEYPDAQVVSVDYASLCVGAMVSGGGVRDTEGIRRMNELYLGDNGRYAFNNRSVLEKRPVQQLPTGTADAIYAALATGQFTPSPVVNQRGFRWTDKAGSFIEYNTQGQVVAFGDRNNNKVWMVRDGDGIVRGVVDANGHVMYSLHYTGELVTEVRDYPAGANDLPARRVNYQYDALNRLRRVTDVRGNFVNYEYDAGNHIVKVTDQEGREEQLSYNGDIAKQRTAPDGTLTDYVFEFDDVNKQFISKITGPETSAGRRVDDLTHNRANKLVRRIANGRTEEEVRYDTGARAEISTNARGFVTRTTRNEFDQIIEVAHPDGATQKRAYSAIHLGVVEETDELGYRTLYDYDALGNVVKTTQAAGTPDERVIAYDLDATGRPTKVTLKGRTEFDGSVTADAIWQFQYDDRGQIKTAIDPEGRQNRITFDRAGNTTELVDGRNNVTRFEVDAAGNLVKITNARGDRVSLVYDKVGNQLSYLDGRGKLAQMAYDRLNRMTRMINPVGGEFRVGYDAQGQPIQETDEDGRITRMEFDTFLRLTKEVDALGNTTTHSYQVADGTPGGRLGTLIYPTEVVYPTFKRLTRYDARERPTTETLLNPNALGTEGLVSSTSYDGRGQVLSETNANGKTTFFAYNAFGQLIEIKDSLDYKTKARYDARGNLLQVTDAKGNATRYAYDRSNRLLSETLPLGQATTYQYDEAGNLRQRVDASGNKSVFDYDENNRIRTARRYDATGRLTRTTDYALDAEGNLTGWTDTDHLRSETTRSGTTFDDANRKTAESITFSSGHTLSYGYGYSAAGLKTRLTWADGTAIDYGYSAHGELESVNIPGEGLISVNQFKWTAPEKVTLPGGTVQDRTYDGLLNLESLRVRNGAAQTTLTVQNTYGKVQELKANSRTDSTANASSTRSGTYTYDDETRLTRSQIDSAAAFNTATESFTLDAVGNRVAHSQVSGAWTYDANNRLTQRGTGANATTYAYDDVGNLTRKTEPGGKVTVYAYDTQNRLVQISNGAGQVVARYGYDPLNRRIWKEQFRDAAFDPLPQPRRTHYLYADEGLIAESTQDITLNPDQTVTLIGQPRLTTQYGPTPDADFGTEVLFIKTKDSNGQDMVAYYHHDQLGAPIQATNKNGDVVWAANYNVFGQAEVTTPAATALKPTIVSNLRLPGQYYDEESGLHYNFFRYYDPTTGRYTQDDPAGLEAGINRYTYASVNPLTSVDPYGLFDISNAATWPSLPDSWVTPIVGVGDGILSFMTLGLWNGNWVRESLGISTVDTCSDAYQRGFLAGELAAALILSRGRCPCCKNSFSEDTLVHARPPDSPGSDAAQGKTILKAISDLAVGDEVLAFREWGEKGRLSYEKVTDIFRSLKRQMLVELTLGGGQKLIATEGHPIKTINGWRDALTLTPGTKILLLTSGSEEPEERVAHIEDVLVKAETVSVYNLEVANAHTYFVGEQGVLVHNDIHHICTNKSKKWSDKFRQLFEKNKKGAGRKDPLNDPENKINIPGHKGPHPDAYHQELWDRLSAASRRGVDAFNREWGTIRNEMANPNSGLRRTLGF